MINASAQILEIKMGITYTESEARDFVINYLVDQESNDFRNMLRESIKPAGMVDYEKIGRVFKRAYDNCISDYVSAKL